MKKILAIVLAAVMSGYVLPVSGAHYVVLSSTNSLLDSPPYGYTTWSDHAFHGTGQIYVDGRDAHDWTQGTTNVNYYINTAGMVVGSGFSTTLAKQKIEAAENSWYNSLSGSSKIFSLSNLGDTTRKPSLVGTECGTSGLSDTFNDVGFCDLASSTFAQVNFFHNGDGTIAETDMTFNSDYTWHDNNNPPNKNITNTALHEWGHVYGLGDLYQVYGGSRLNCQGSTVGVDQSNVMCFEAPTLGWGDKDGIKWLYPKPRGTFNVNPSGTVRSSDAAVECIDSTEKADMLFLWADWRSTAGETDINVKPIWNMGQKVCGVVEQGDDEVGIAGSTVTLVTVSDDVHDIGATLYNIDGDSIPDLILTYSQKNDLCPNTTADQVCYMIFWDIQRSSTGSNIIWSGTSGPFKVVGSTIDRGTDATVFDMNGDGVRDLVIVNSYYDSFDAKYELWYYYGTLSTGGSVSTWYDGASSGTYNLDKKEVGVSVPDPDKRIFAVSTKRSDRYIDQNLIHFDITSLIDNQIGLLGESKTGSLHRLPTATNEFGLGAGDAFNILEQPEKEMFYVWVYRDTATNLIKGRYIIDYDSRLNSHG